MLYSLFAPMWDTNDVLRKLLREVLGYTDDEIKILESECFCRNIVNKLTVEQARSMQIPVERYTHSEISGIIIPD